MNKGDNMKSQISIRDTDIKLTDLLKLISEGYSYPQMLEKHPELHLGDIMAAAALALQVIQEYVTNEDTIEIHHTINVTAHGKKLLNLTKVREKYPRAFMPWKTDEETSLIELFRNGATIENIASIHKRKVGAIKSRLEKLGLIPSGTRPASRI